MAGGESRLQSMLAEVVSMDGDEHKAQQAPVTIHVREGCQVIVIEGSKGAVNIYSRGPLDTVTLIRPQEHKQRSEHES